MATKNSNNMNNNVTRVICQNCGAEIIIPANEAHVSGIAIGKDSGLGTVVLPTIEGTGKQMDKKQAAAKLAEIAKANPELAELITSIASGIQDNGYIEMNLDWRWIPSQALNMFYSRNGFHYSLTTLHSYFYSWDVIIADLKRQMKRYEKGDMAGFRDRNRWYNAATAKAMANHYVEMVMKHIQEMPVHSHKSRKYVKLNVRWINRGKGVHVDEFKNFESALYHAAQEIGEANTPKKTLDAVEYFYSLIDQIRWVPNKMCPDFVNAYKAAGAYYTIKDLIMFEGQKMKVQDNGSTDDHYHYCYRINRSFVEKEESLAALDRKANDIVERGVSKYGYEMLGLLKDFLRYNNFDFDATKKEWKEQSEARRMMRAANRNNRRPRN